MTVTKKRFPSPSSVMEEYEKSNSFHSIKYFHRFINKNYDCHIVYLPPVTGETEQDITQYTKNKNVSYSFTMHNVESTVMKSRSASARNKFIPNKDSNPYPLAVRFADHEKGVYVVERPPFQVDVDYSMKKHANRKEVSFLFGRKIWIPWTISLLNYNGCVAESYVHRLFFSDKSVSSFEDLLYYPVLPNLFSDSRICFGDSTLHVNQRIKSKELNNDISSLFSYFFNDYFSSWNADLTLHVRSVYQILRSMDIFSRSKGIKKLPKYIAELDTWLRNGSKFWASFLFFMSLLTYEETIEFYTKLSSLDFNDRAKHHNTTLGRILSSEYLIDDNYSKDYIDNMIKNLNSKYDTWQHVLTSNSIHSIFDCHINVSVKNIPEGKLLDQEFIANPNLSAYMYYTCLRNYCNVLSGYCYSNNMHMGTSTIDPIVAPENLSIVRDYVFTLEAKSGQSPLQADHYFKILEGFENSDVYSQVQNYTIVVNYEDVLSNKNFLE